MDKKALEAYETERDGIAVIWRAGMMDIIKTQNREMYDRMGLLQDHLDVLMLKDAMTKEERKRFTQLLAAWRKIHELGVVYASRHL